MSYRPLKSKLKTLSKNLQKFQLKHHSRVGKAHIYIQEYLRKILILHKGDKVDELVDTASTLSILIIYLGPSRPAEYFFISAYKQVE
jgi:hypothetical protein